MKIAQVAPLFESVPPRVYGGTERVVSYLTEALVEMGHEVTLSPAATPSLRPAWFPCASRPATGSAHGPTGPAHHHDGHGAQGGAVLRRDPLPHRCASARSGGPLPDRLPIDRPRPPRLAGPEAVIPSFPRHPMVSISASQRAPLALAQLACDGAPRAADGLVFAAPATGGLFRFRRAHLAREARRPGHRDRQGLRHAARIAAKVDPADKAYFESTIITAAGRSTGEYVGEIGDEAKDDFIGNARALLCPSTGPNRSGW